MTDKELHVSKIENGTVIDHIDAGQGMNVLALLGIDGSDGESVSVIMNFQSETVGNKDIVKIQNRELSQDELDVLSLVSPDVTINIILDYEVHLKHRVQRPKEVIGILTCPNRNCITNTKEPILSKFNITEEIICCEYCGTHIQDVAHHLS